MAVQAVAHRDDDMPTGSEKIGVRMGKLLKSKLRNWLRAPKYYLFYNFSKKYNPSVL